MKAILIPRSNLDGLFCDVELLKTLANVRDTCNFIVSGHDCWFGGSGNNEAAWERFAGNGLLRALWRLHEFTARIPKAEVLGASIEREVR